MAKLGDVIEQIRGVSYKPSDLSDKLDDNSVVLLRANNIKNGDLVFDDVVYVSKNRVNERQYLKRGDILVCTSSGSKELVGKAAFVRADLPMVFGAFCKVIRPRIEYAEYIGHFFQSPYYRNHISAASAGANINNLRNEHIADLQISIPPLDEQRKVVAVLDKVSGLIAKRQAQLDKLDLLVKARFVEMFGDLMFNPYHWPIAKISDVSTYLKSGLSRRLSDEDIGLPVIRSGNIQNGEFIYENIKYWYKDDPQGSKTEDYILDDGDILINFINSASQIGKTAIFRDVGRGCIYTTNIFRMKLADNCNEHYYNWFAMSDYYYRQLQNIIQPAVNQASFTTTNFLKLSIPLPPINKQKEFANFVKQTSKSTMEIQKSLAKLEILKKALMQKYFG